MGYSFLCISIQANLVYPIHYINRGADPQHLLERDIAYYRAKMEELLLPVRSNINVGGFISSSTVDSPPTFLENELVKDEWISYYRTLVAGKEKQIQELLLQIHSLEMKLENEND